MARHTAHPSTPSPYRFLALIATIVTLLSLSAGALLAAPPALQVAVTDSLATTTPGAQLTYTVRVSNTGGADLSGVTARIQIATGEVTFVDASDTPTDLTNGLYEWNIGTLVAGRTLFRYLTVDVKKPLATGTVITTSATGLESNVQTSNTANDTTIVEAPKVTLAPASLSFGAQQVGTQSAAQTVTLSNEGSQPLTISSITTTNGAFTVSGCAGPVAPSASCVIDVVFAPTAAGAQSATLNVNDDAAGSPHSIALSGTGTQPAITFAPDPLAFADQRLSTTSAPQQITLSNTGTAPLKITNIVAGGEFAVSGTTCPSGSSTLAVNGTCTVDVTFTPSGLGARSGTLTVTSDAFGNPRSVALSGNGVQPGAQLDKSALSFGGQSLNTTSASQQVTLSNNGSMPLTITSIDITGDFAKSTTCGSQLAVGASCTIDVTFTPTALGARTGQLSVNDDAPGAPHKVDLDGTGLGAAVQITPASLDFGSLDVGATSAASDVTLKNIGNVDLTITSITASGDYARTTTCSGTLAPNASCTVSVTFTPTARGTRSGTLTFADSAPGGAQTVALTGVGLQPELTVSPTSLDFGNQRLNTTSVARQVTLMNTGNKDLTITSIGISGDFAKGATCVGTLAPNASCLVDITFTPTATGARSGTLPVNDNAPGNPHIVVLSGAGTNPQATLNPTSLDFGSRQVNTSATQDIVLTNSGVGALTIGAISTSGDYSQTNNCPASLPQGANCTISVTFTPLAQQTRTGTLTVPTDATGSPSTAALTGIGIQPVVSLNPTSLDFGSLALNATSTPQSITLTNTGSQPLALSGIAASSGYAQTNTCPAAPATIAVGASCTINVSFTPTSVGPQNGALTITSNAPSSPHTLTLTGVGSGAVYVSAPAPGVLPMSSVIGASNTVSITVSNEGNQPLNVSAPAGSIAAPFSVAPAAAYTVQPGANQVVAVRCAPTGVGPFTQQLVYITNDALKPAVTYNIVCTGTLALAASYTSSPSAGGSLALGAAPVGRSVSADLTISESGTAPLIVAIQGGAAAIAGANAGDFAILAPASFPLTIPDGGAAQTLTVRCQPSAVGARAATLTLITNDPAQPIVSYALTCTGQGATAAQSRVFLPLVAQAAAAPQAGKADLVASVSVAPSGVKAGEPAEVRVTVSNQGNAAASEFWVDLYINPSAAPTGPNQPWNGRCTLNPCYGIAWYVTQSLAPGQSVTLTSVPDSYYAKNTIWEGAFAPGTTDLYAYADSWNPTVADGAVAESDETNNRAELHGLNVGAAATPALTTRSAADLPERPARPGR